MNGSSERDEQAVPIGRLAPSPTGALHIGNARSFLLAWLSIRTQRGQLLLRIEDIDSPRIKPWALQQTIDDLRWLGLDWDNDGDSQLLLQTERLDRFAEVFELLRGQGHIYPCVCSRRDVETAASAPHDQVLPALEGTVYPGTCRGVTHPSLPERYAWRWKFEGQTLTWQDAVLGVQTAEPQKQLGDFVIAKQTPGFTPAYQLAVVVDDMDSGITEVLRGDDLRYSTFRQLAILQALGERPPDYIHVPLVIGKDGKRLAKRHGDTRLSHLRDQGIKAEALVGFLAQGLKLISELRPMTARELLAELDGNLPLQTIPLGPSVFDLERDLPTLRKLSS